MEQKAKEAASHAAIPVSISAMLVTLGVVYGDIGTSPMYVTKALVAGNGGIGSVTEEFVLGALSLVVWTVTLLTTVKYVLISLRADNHGEGGIFALYSLVKRCGKWLIIPAMLGGAALLADGILTPGGERKDARGDAVACDAGPGAAGEDGVGQNEHYKGERLVLGDEAHGAPNGQKDLEQTEGDAPSKSALGNGARLRANGFGLAQDKEDGRRKTDERDGGCEHAETPHKLKTTKAGVYPIVTKICAAIGGCAQQPAILARMCGGVAQCSGDLRDNGRELHGNVKAS